MSETATAAEFIARTTYDRVPSRVIERAKHAVRDYAGVAMHATGEKIGTYICDYVDACLPGTTATVIDGSMASPAGAALANGTLGHAIDYDDTFESVSIHPTSPIFSAALAAGEATGATTRDLLLGYVVGSEVAFALERAVSPAHYQNGWHSTGTTGSFGATAAAACVADLKIDEVRRALGIAASCASSHRKNFGSMTKPLHAGHAAQMGVRSVFLARSGFTADNHIFEGSLGYGAVMVPGDEYAPGTLIDRLSNDAWSVETVAFKPYPSGALTHAPMEALLRLVRAEDIVPTDVESIRAAVDESTRGVLRHETPETPMQGKFSLEFCLALILCERHATIEEFTREKIADNHVRTQMPKVEREYQEDLFEGEYDRRGCRLSITLTDGTVYETEERYTPGGPTNPVDDSRLQAKFYRCVESISDEETADRLAAAIEELDSPDIQAKTFTAQFE